jgi:hypothetical protein
MLLVKGQPMRNRLPVRHQVTCVTIAICIWLVYVGFYLCAVGSAWQLKEGDFAPISPWLRNASLFPVAFPLGFLASLRTLFVAPVLNGLLWSTMACFLFARYACRKIA